jgi:hypothetical protein
MGPSLSRWLADPKHQGAATEEERQETAEMAKLGPALRRVERSLAANGIGFFMFSVTKRFEVCRHCMHEYTSDTCVCAGSGDSDICSEIVFVSRSKD